MSKTRQFSKNKRITTNDSNTKIVRKRPYSSRSVGRIIIRKASTWRKDRLEIVSVSVDDDHKSNKEEDKNKISDTATTNAKNAEVKGESSTTPISKGEVKAETPCASTVNVTHESLVGSGTVGETSKSSESPKERPENETNKTATTATLKRTTRVLMLHPQDLKDYQEAEDRQKKAVRNIESARQQVYKDQVQQVWGLYMYGLKHVLSIKDLSDAPDAIMKTM